MKPILYPNCEFYFFNRSTLEFGIIDVNLLTAQRIDNRISYSLIENHNPNLLIVQAINEKSASSKFLTIIANSPKS